MTEDVRLDFARRERIGIEEAVMCAGKSVAQIATIVDQAVKARRGLLLTRLAVETLAGLPAGRRRKLDYDPVSRTAVLGRIKRPRQPAMVAIVAAGTSDLPVVREAERSLNYTGVAVDGFLDVGVAGLWRLLDRIEEIRKYPVVIAVAGMEGALFSVLGGLVGGAVIAVPTSTGYGMTRGGETALGAALVSCAPGLVAVNIDNGYGAACAALRILAQIARNLRA